MRRSEAATARRRVFLALCAQTALADAAATFYWRLPNTDVPGNSITQLPQKLPDQLMAHCNADPSCLGFITDASMSLGFLKSSVATTQPSAGVDLFVKHSLPSAPRLTLMPVPNSIQMGNESVLVASPVDGFSMLLQGDSADLRAAVARYISLTFPVAGRTLVDSGDRVLSAAAAGNSLAVLNITVRDPSAPLSLGVDESYTITVPADGSPASLSAGTVYGALRGLETFSQLVQFDYDSGLYFIPSAPILIADAPAFPYRGMMIDTSAHFVPVPVLRHLIDSMAFAKLNVLHWHIVDQASFPMQSHAYPQLWNSAWSPRERYTLADAAALVEYGRQRGVLIVPEQDNPSHADAICLTYPEACTFASCDTWTNPLNPAVNASYELVDAVMREWQAVFPGGIMHQGGDELDTDCWLQDPIVAAWLAANNMTTLDAYRYWVERTYAMASQLNQTVMRWQDVWDAFGTQLPQDIIVHVWLNLNTIANATNHGYRVVASNNAATYLDDFERPWTAFYDNAFLEGVANTALVLGTEACMWLGHADSGDVLRSIWPRAAALAERAWSYHVATTSADPLVQARLADFRCLLLSRGIPSDVLFTDTTGYGPMYPGSCSWQ